MAITTTFPRLIGRDDIALGNGSVSTDGHTTVKLNASHIPFANVASYLEYVPIKPGDIETPLNYGDSGTEAALIGAVNACGTDDKTIFIPPVSWDISADLSIGSNITLFIPSGALLTVAVGKTLTISGPIIAGAYQIFAGAGTIVLGGVNTIYDSWFASAPTTPENNVVAGIGSTFFSTSGSTPIMYVKESGAGDTGWQGYDDSTFVHLTGNETIAGVKTFSSIPVGPASDPTTSNQFTRKSYVDTLVGSPPGVVILGHLEPSGTDAGGQANGSWAKRTVNTILLDTEGICDLTDSVFTLPAGTYDIMAAATYWACNQGIFCLCDDPGSLPTLSNVLDVNGNELMSIRIYASSGAGPLGVLQGRFTLAVSTDLCIASRVGASNVASAWGQSSDYGTVETYLTARFVKVS